MKIDTNDLPFKVVKITQGTLKGQYLCYLLCEDDVEYFGVTARLAINEMFQKRILKSFSEANTLRTIRDCLGIRK